LFHKEKNKIKTKTKNAINKRMHSQIRRIKASHTTKIARHKEKECLQQIGSYYSTSLGVNCVFGEIYLDFE